MSAEEWNTPLPRDDQLERYECVLHCEESSDHVALLQGAVFQH